MKEKIEINTMIARNVYATESYDFVKLVLEKFCKVEIPNKAKEIHKQNKLYDYKDEFRLYGTKEQGIKYHSYYKLLDKDTNIPSLYTVSNESFGIENLWIKFTISSQDGLILELDSKDNSLVEKVVSLFEKQFSYCRKQSQDEIFDELIHEIRTKGSEDKGKFGIKLGQKAIKIYPDDYWAQFYLGCSFALNGQHKKAIQHLLLAVKQDPKSYDALYNLAKSYLESSKLDNAEETMLKAQKLAKNNHTINYYLAVIFEKRGKKDEAKKYYKIAIETAPKKVSAEKLGASSFLQQAKQALEKLS
ncbi:MAG: tetratricopeptide repeat protein [Candidatus Heimdallarchaeota archaeon]